jgi:hypothetical protein
MEMPLVECTRRLPDCGWNGLRAKIPNRFKYAQRICLICTCSLVLAWCIIESNKTPDYVELSSHMRGSIGHHAQSSNGDIHSTASRHASNPLVITPDIAKALGKADSVLKSTQRLLGNQHDKESVDDDDDQGNDSTSAHIEHTAAKLAAKPNLQPVDQHQTSPVHANVHSPKHAVNRETPKELAKEKAEAELWKTEQAMKKELDAQTAHKSGKLWQHTVHIVHRTDPSAKLISKLAPDEASGDIKKALSLKRVESKPDTIKSRLKAELDAKTKNDMGRIEDKTVALQKQGLDRVAHESKVAETATAHKAMPLSDMKKMLTSQLDASVNHDVKHGSSIKASVLEKRLKDELDAKTQEQEKKLLQSQNAKRSLVLTRRKLHGRVVRAAKVRQQLSKEMAEENAIRKQLDLRAEKAGKRMLRSEMSGSTPDAKRRSRGASREALEAALRKRLETRTRQILKSRRRGAPRAAQGKPDGMEKEVRARLDSAKKDGHPFHLQDYLRNQLDASDASTQKQLYRKTVQGNLIKRMHTHGSAKAAARARALHAAAMRLFKASMRRSERRDTGARPAPRDIAQERRALDASLKGAAAHGRPADKATAELMKETLQRAGDHAPFAGLHREEEAERQQVAAAPPPPSVHTATVALMKEALQRSGGHRPFAALHRREALESRAVAARQSRAVDVHTAVERVMESSLRRAKGVRPFADLHDGAAAAGAVHDMASANRESTLRAGGLARAGKLDPLVLGHYAALQDADATADAIRQARTKAVHEAEQEEQQAVE